MKKQNGSKHKYSLFLAILVSAVIFTLISVVGKFTIYQGYDLNLWKTPILSVMFEAVKDGVYPWDIIQKVNEQNVVATESSQSGQSKNSQMELSQSDQKHEAGQVGKDTEAESTDSMKEEENSEETESGKKNSATGKEDSTKEDSATRKEDPTKGDSATGKEDSTKEDSATRKEDPTKGDSATGKEDSTKGDSATGKEDSMKGDSAAGKEDSTKGDSATGKEDSTKEDSEVGKNESSKKDSKKENPKEETDATEKDSEGSKNDTITKVPGKNTDLELGEVEQAYFDDALFIGDSRTVGLSEYSYLDNATYYSDVGLSVYSVFNKKIAKIDKKSVTLEEALKKKQFKKVYIMLGINELGTGTTKTFVAKYKEMIDQILELQPDAYIMIQAIMNVGKEMSDTDKLFNNKNISDRNEGLETLADNQQIFYINVNEALTDKNGYIPEDYTFDSIHLKGKYYDKWADFLMKNGVVTK